MILDFNSVVPSARESMSSKIQSLPSLSARAASSDKRLYAQRTGMVFDKVDIKKSLKLKRDSASFYTGRSSRPSSNAKADPLSRLYEKVSANLMGKLSDSFMNAENSVHKAKSPEIEKQKTLSIAFLSTADSFKHFLEPHTNDFFEAVEQSKAEISFDVHEPRDDDLKMFLEKQTETFSIFKKVFEECIVGKILARKGYGELGKVILTVIETIFGKFTRVINGCKPHLKTKNFLSEQKEQQALMATKNEKNLFESIKLVNFLHNPLFDLDETVKQKYIHDLIKCKQVLRENKTSFRIDVVNNFEEDLKKLTRIFHETKNQNEIVSRENRRLKALIEEINRRYDEDRGLIKFQNAQLIQQKKEKEKRKNQSREASPSPEGTLITLQMQDNEHEKEDILASILRDNACSTNDHTVVGELHESAKKGEEKAAKNPGSQAFVITYLEKELKSLEAELNKSKQEGEKLKADKASLTRKIQEIEEKYQDRHIATKEVAIQCAFSSDKEGYVEAQSTLDKILEGKDSLKMTAVPHEEEWLLLMINMIYQEKVQADLLDDYEGRQRKNLRDYCKEWFLTRFGLQQVAEVMLRDFLKTLAQFVPKHPRYKTFGMLVGLPDAYDFLIPEVMSTNGKDDEKVIGEYFKRQFIMSHYGISLLNKAALSLPKDAKNSTNFERFLPDIKETDEDLLEIKGLKVILRNILDVLKLPKEDSQQILGQFDSLVEGDAYFRLVERQYDKGNGKVDIDEEIEKGLSVRTDYFLKFVLESVALCFSKQLGQVYTQIRLHNEFVKHANVSVDLYRDVFSRLDMNKSARWVDVTYDILMQKDLKHCPPLSQTLGLLVPYIISRPPLGRAELPEDGYPIFQPVAAGQYNEKDVMARVKKLVDLEGNFKLLKVTHQFVKTSLSKYQKRAGNLDLENDLLEKDMNNINTAMNNQRFSFRQGDRDKIKNSLDVNWMRLRKLLKVRHFVPKEL